MQWNVNHSFHPPHSPSRLPPVPCMVLPDSSFLNHNVLFTMPCLLSNPIPPSPVGAAMPQTHLMYSAREGTNQETSDNSPTLAPPVSALAASQCSLVEGDIPPTSSSFCSQNASSAHEAWIAVASPVLFRKGYSWNKS